MNNSNLQSALGSVLRWGLMIAAGYLVKKGIWTDSDAVKYVEAGSVALLALGWSLWEKYQSRIKLMTALVMPVGSTENDVLKHIASGAATPTTLTPPNTAPGVPLTTPVDAPVKPA